jgi:lipopolysaccharide exporter
LELLWQFSNEHICIVKFNLTSGYLKHILTLLSGTAFGQLVLLIALPFLTRLFSPTDFGLYGVFIAVTSIVGMVSNGRFDLAILIPKAEEEARSVYHICYQFALGISILLLVLCISVPSTLLGDYGLVIWWIPLSILLQGLLQPATRWLLRGGRFQLITISKISGSIVTVGVSIGLAFLDYGFEGLIIGKISGQVTETAISGGFRVFLWNPFGFAREVFTRFIGFLKYSTFEALLNNLFKQVPVLALSGYFSEALAGFYTLAMNVTSRPSGMVSQSVSQVFFKEASNMDNSVLPSFFIKNIKGLFGLIILPAVIVGFFGSDVFEILFGDEWSKAGRFASWLMPFVVITFIKAGVSPILDIKNKMRYNLFFELGFVLLSLLSFVTGHFLDNADLGVILFSCTNSFLGLFQLYAFFRWSKSKSSFQ